jgi:hypothetical protein
MRVGCSKSRQSWHDKRFDTAQELLCMAYPLCESKA